MVKQRQKFDKQFKMDTVRMIEESERSVAEIARELGIHPNVLYRWRNQYLTDPDQSFPGKGRLKPAEEELRKLRRELDVVREERDILKKALAVFSRRVH
jgi:transposase